MSIERFLFPLRRLHDEGVSFVLVGGLAVIVHGHMRLTMDLDIAISLEEENVIKTFSCLSAVGYLPRVPVILDEISKPGVLALLIQTKNMKALNLWRPPDPFSELDILVDLPIPFTELLRDSSIIDLEETKIHVASIPHLIRMKELAGRETDKGDIQALTAIQAERARRS